MNKVHVQHELCHILCVNLHKKHLFLSEIELVVIHSAFKWEI